MSKDNFDHLLDLVTPHIKKQDTNMREAVEPGLKLAVTLHHLAEGASHCSIAAHYRLGRSTVSQIIYDTCEALYTVLQPVYMPVPSSADDWKKISSEYVCYYNAIIVIILIIILIVIINAIVIGELEIIRMKTVFNIVKNKRFVSCYYNNNNETTNVCWRIKLFYDIMREGTIMLYQHFSIANASGWRKKKNNSV